MVIRRSARNGLFVLIIWAMLFTVLRAIRFPNNYAEAHWLMDYRFGFIKRGLIGSVTDILSRLNILPQSETSIAALSFAAFILFCIVLLFASYRILVKSGWSSDSFLTVCVFLTSPFLVMSAHLNGYFDNIVIMLAFASAWLTLHNRAWLAACIATTAVLIHESFMLIGFPLVLLAAYLRASPIIYSKVAFRQFIPFLLPAFAFLLLVLSETVLVNSENLRQMLSVRFAGFDFIQQNRSQFVPKAITTHLLEHLHLQTPHFLRRLSNLEMLHAVFPPLLTIFYFAFRNFRVKLISFEACLIAVVTLTPLLMHAVAWDTNRIWTYVILTAFGCAWLWRETTTEKKLASPSLIALLAFPALILNVLGRMTLMDGEAERFTDFWRVMMYAPLFVGFALVIWIDQRGVRRPRS